MLPSRSEVEAGFSLEIGARGKPESQQRAMITQPISGNCEFGGDYTVFGRCQIPTACIVEHGVRVRYLAKAGCRMTALGFKRRSGIGQMQIFSLGHSRSRRAISLAIAGDLANRDRPNYSGSTSVSDRRITTPSQMNHTICDSPKISASDSSG